MKAYKKEIIEFGKLLWDKNLVSVLNGNISLRVGEQILITATKTCLGFLKDQDIVCIDMEGNVIGEGAVSTENKLHRDIYQAFPGAQAIIHTHNVYTNAYFLEQAEFVPRIYENKFWFSSIKSVPQSSPNCQDTDPVIAELKRNNVMVMGRHGTVAMGKTLFDSFLLVQELEEAIKVECISRMFRAPSSDPHVVCEERKDEPQKECGKKKVKMFSQAQIDAIVELVNNDPQMKAMGEQTAMNMELAIKLNETGEIFSFLFKEGRIDQVGQNADAEFLVSAPEVVWRSVFNSQVDPFVATTQKKMDLRGDFAKISKWYAPCSRVFELWTQVEIV